MAFEGFTLIPTPPNLHDSLGVQHVPEQDILSCVTKDSQRRWVTIINESHEYALQTLLGRPFFLLVYIDAPLLTRWARYKNRFVSGCPPSYGMLMTA